MRNRPAAARPDAPRRRTGSGVSVTEAPDRTRRNMADLLAIAAAINAQSVALLFKAAEATKREGLSFDQAVRSFEFARLAVEEDEQP
jgi:hypothetical protein